MAIQTMPNQFDYRGTMSAEMVADVALNLPAKEAYGLLSVIGSGFDLFTDTPAKNFSAGALENTPLNFANDTSFWKLWGQVNPEVRDNGLFQAMRGGKIEVMKGLIESYGLPLDQIIIDGKGLFWHAIVSNNPDVVRVFLDDYGMEVDKEVEDALVLYTCTPLQLSVQTPGGIEVTKLLLERGAEGLDNALFLAALTPHPEEELITFLHSQGASLKNEHGLGTLFFTCYASTMHFSTTEEERNSHREVARLLLSFGEDPNYTDNNTAILDASEHGYSRGIQALVDLGADPNVRRAMDGSTPLHLAATRGDYDTALALIQAGADPTIQDMFGNTPLDVAKVDEMEGREAIIQLLENAKHP